MSPYFSALKIIFLVELKNGVLVSGSVDISNIWIYVTSVQDHKRKKTLTGHNSYVLIKY